jgi:MFS family permease
MRILTLGTSWLLVGLEVTLVGSLAGILTSPKGLSLTDVQVTAAATTYLAGAVFGALLFGYLTDRLGRKRLFLVTVATYPLARSPAPSPGASGLSPFFATSPASVLVESTWPSTPP